MMNRLIVVAVLALIASHTLAQSKPASNPDTAPTTSPASRPSDPLAAGDWEFRHANFAAAAEAYAKAPPTAVNLCRLGAAQMEMARATTTGVERAGLLDKAKESLRKSLAADPNGVDAQRLLTEMAWGSALASHRWTDFISEAGKLLAKDGNDHMMFFRRAAAKAEELIAEASSDANKIDSTLADFRRAVQIRQQETRYWVEMIRFLQRHRDADVVPTFQNALKVNPESYTLRSAYGSYLRSKGRTEDSLRQVELAMAQDPNNTMGYVIRAQHFEAIKSYDEAFKSLKDALAKDNTDPRVYRQLAVLHLAQGQPQQATETMRDAVKVIAAQLGPKNTPQAAARLQEAISQLQSMLGSLLSDRLKAESANHDKVMDEFRQFVMQLDQMLPQTQLRARYAGLLAHLEDRAAQAIPLLERSLGQADGSIDLQVAEPLARDYLRVGQAKRGEALANAVLLQLGTNKTAFWTTVLAEADLYQRDFPAATAHIDEALKLDANDAPAATLRSIIDVLRGDSNTLPADLKLTSAAIDLLVQRAGQLAAAKKEGEGLALLEELHRRDGRHRGVLFMLLDAYGMTGKAAEADKLLAEIRAADPAMAAQIQDELSMRREKDPQKQFEIVKARIIREIPEMLPRTLALARLCQATDHPQEYQQYVAEAAKLDANNPEVIERSFQLAGLQQDWAKASEWAQHAAANNIDSVGGRHYTARIAMGKRDANTAITLLEEGLKLQPQWNVGKVLLAQCYQDSNRLDKARQIFEEVYKADPNSASAAIGLAVLSEMEHKSAEHATWVERAMKLPEAQRNPYILSEFLNQRQIQAKPEDVDKIIEGRKQLFAQNPRDVQNALALAVLLEQANRPQDAKAIYAKVYELSPSKLMGVRPLAEYLIRKGENSELIQLLSGLQEREPDKTGARVVAAQYLRYYSPEMAMATLERAVEADPNDPRPYENIGRFYEAQRKWKEAIGTYERLRSIMPSRLDASKAILRCLIEMKDYEQSDKAMAALLLAAPQDIDVLMLQAQLSGRNRRYDQALASYGQVLTKDSNYLPAVMGRLYVLLAMNDGENLRKELAALRAKYSSPDVLMEYASICLQRGDAKSAEAAYLDILKEQNNNLSALRALTSMYAERRDWASLESRLAGARAAYPADLTFVLIESEMWKARGAADKQLAALEAAVKIAPNSLEASGALLTVLLDANQFDRALATAEPMLAKPEIKPLALAVKGRALLATGKGPQAEEAFIAAISENVALRQLGMIGHQFGGAYGPAKGAEKLTVWIRQRQLDNPYLGVLLSMLYVDAKDYAKGIEVLLKARELMKTDEEKTAISITLANIYYRNKQYAPAKDIYLELLRAQPDDVQTLNNLAFLYAEDLKDPNGALPYAKRAMELAPGNPSILDTYAWTLFLAGRANEATPILFKVVEMMPDSSVLRYHLGRAQEKVGSTADAQRQYEEGLRTAGDAPIKKDLQEALDRLKPPTKK